MSAPVSRALASGRPVVALESSVFAQGLPRPANAIAARKMVHAITSAGALPAITAILRGSPVVGLDRRHLSRFLQRDGIRKVSARDLAYTAALGGDGATTVAAAIVLAHYAGVSVLATGGIGGVHRGEGYDESADLIELSRTPIIVVCSGPKVILDVRATTERLESLGITVVGYCTDRMPAFYTEGSDLSVSVRVESASEIAAIFASHLALERPGTILVVQPPASGAALASAAVETAVKKGLRAATRAGVRGPAVTPFLLEAVEQNTGGTSVAVNIGLLERNAKLAAEIAGAVAMARNNR